MTRASELVHLPPSISFWQAYDPAVKADLFTTAVSTSEGIYLIDPIPLAEDAFSELNGHIVGLIVTNQNHWRAVDQFASKLSVPVFARSDAFPEGHPSNWKSIGDGEQIGAELRVVAIEWAVAGELALVHSLHGGTVIIGDALINFEPHGFTFLPAKYCSDQKQMRRSLQKLLVYSAERMLFAHGNPILRGATDRLRQLLSSNS